MMKWFQKMTMQELQRKQEVQFNLDTGDIDIIYNDHNNEHVRIPLSLLSDGYKCTISLIADIAYRMALLNPQLLDKVLTETQGIVLIDEIDLHLHPAWQKRILKDLMDIFPKVQFIVSTHAPEVINSVKRDSIVILKDKSVFSAVGETYGKDANTILREIMEVSTRPDAVTGLFEQFYNLLDHEEWRRAEAVLDQLEAQVGNNDAEVNSCRVRLELEQM